MQEVVVAHEWELLNDQPSEEGFPEALRAPTASPALNLGVQVIGSNIVGNDVVEVAAQYMAEHARLEMWMGRHRPPLGFRQQFEMGRAAHEGLILAHEAWIAFQAAYQVSGRKVDHVRDERERLKAALCQATDALVSARGDD